LNLIYLFNYNKLIKIFRFLDSCSDFADAADHAADFADSADLAADFADLAADHAADSADLAADLAADHAADSADLAADFADHAADLAADSFTLPCIYFLTTSKQSLILESFGNCLLKLSTTDSAQLNDHLTKVILSNTLVANQILSSYGILSNFKISDKVPEKLG
jgi:hypothetical protein